MVHYVQLAHHTDLWSAGNPVRALTDGVRRLVSNLRPPRSNNKVVDKLREEGERFLGTIQAVMLQHLRECQRTSDEELRQTKPPIEGDDEIIAKQAKSLLRKNYGQKLTTNDVDCHLEDACTLLAYDEREEVALRRGNMTASTTTAPRTSVWVDSGDEDNNEGEEQTQAQDVATTQRATGNTHTDTIQQTNKQTKTLRLLTAREDIIIRPADKGSSVCISLFQKKKIFKLAGTGVSKVRFGEIYRL